MGLLTNAMTAGSGRNPHDDFWYRSTGVYAGSGAMVTPDTAMRFSTVFACTRILMETLGSVPLRLFTRLERGRERAETDHLYGLLHDQPNDWQTSMEFREMMQGHVTLRGNAYAEIISGRGNPVDQLIPLHPDRVEMSRLDNRTLRYYHREEDGSRRDIPARQMFHLRGLSLDGYKGLSVIEYERETVGLGLASVEHQGKIMKNDGKLNAYIKYPGKFKDPERRSEFRDQLQEALTGRNRGKMPVLEDGLEIETLGLTNREIQYIETRKFTREEIAGIFRIPLVLLQAGDRTQTYASAEQFFLSFVKFTMVPWFFRWEQAIQRDLVLNPNQYAKFIVEGLLRGDTAARKELYNEGITDGWLTRNEVREKEDMNPLPGLDEPLQQLNMSPPDTARAMVRKERIALEEMFDSTETRKEFHEKVKAFYPDFRQDLRTALNLSISEANRYIEGSLITLKQKNQVILGPDWENARLEQLMTMIE